MSKYMIEVDHEAEMNACTQTVQVFRAMGSHFLTRAEWGCLDGVHTAWMIVEGDSREEVRSIVPPPFRSQARITALSGFGSEQIEELMRVHRPAAGGTSPRP